MSFEPLPSKKKADYVVEQILKAIKRGDFNVGERLPPERDLAGLLNVGRSSVREALSMLQISGILEVRHGNGTFVQASPSDRRPWLPSLSSGSGEAFLQLTEARYALEQGVIRLASTQQSEAGISQMNTAVTEMQLAADSSDIDRFLVNNVLFHKGLADASANSFLINTAAQLSSHLSDAKLQRVRKFFYERNLGRLQSAYSVHLSILRAIQGGDQAAALEALNRHYGEVASPIINREQ